MCDQELLGWEVFYVYLSRTCDHVGRIQPLITPHSKKSEVHPGVSQDNPVLAGSGVRSGRSNNKFKFQHTDSDDRRNGYQ